MKNKINRIWVRSWTNKSTGKHYEIISVRYDRYERTYTQADTLPMTVTMYLIKAPVQTTYIRDSGTENGIKIERYAM